MNNTFEEEIKDINLPDGFNEKVEKLESLMKRVSSYHGKFKLVERYSEAEEVEGEITEKDLETLCDPMPDTLGLCRAILGEIEDHPDMDKGALLEAMLEGGTSDGMEDGMSNRDRIDHAIEMMLYYGFLKLRDDNSGVIISNLDTK